MSKKKKEFNRFEEVRSIIDAAKDIDMTKALQGLLRDLIKINDLEENLEKFRAGLYDDKKRGFYSFFVEGLAPAEICALADKCSGRVKILEKKAATEAERVAELAAKNGTPVTPEESIDDEDSV